MAEKYLDIGVAYTHFLLITLDRGTGTPLITHPLELFRHPTFISSGVAIKLPQIRFRAV